MDSEPLVYIASLLAFVSGVALVESVFLIWRAVSEGHQAKVRRRLEMLSSTAVSAEQRPKLVREKHYSTNRVVNRLLVWLPGAGSLNTFLEQAGMAHSVGTYLGVSAGLIVATPVIIVLVFGLGVPISVLAGLLLGLLGPYLFVTSHRRKRQARLTSQLPDALDYIARSLRAGNPFSVSLKGVSLEMPDPVGTEFRIAFDELNYGLELEEALTNLVNRSSGEEMRYFVTAVLIQKTTGGNMADLLSGIAGVMRERARTQGEIRIHAGEMRLSARVLIALPFVFAGLISIIQPGYIQTLTAHPLGRVVIAIQLMLMALGYVVIHRMVRFRI
jgi:tight adherence protein B